MFASARRTARLAAGLRPKIFRGTLSIAHKSTAQASHQVAPIIHDNPNTDQLCINLPYLSEDETKDYSLVAPDTSDEVLQVISDKIATGYADSFMVCDLRRLHQRHDLWQQHLPRVQPFYAIKCNDNPRILKVMASLGCGFDCASWQEIDTALSLVQPSDIIYANPCKQQSHLKQARKHNVPLMTFDNSHELHKTKSLYPDAQCVLRLATDDTDALVKLSCKFGAHAEEVAPLLSLARSLDLDVVGISFHCGSANSNKDAYTDALKRSREAFELGAQAGYAFKLLDVGGGFPGQTNEDHIFVEIANSMNAHLHHFDDDVRVIAEPGRFYATSTQTLASRVYSLKQQADSSVVYYINDGLYGSFNCILYDHFHPIPRKFVAPGTGTSESSAKTFPTTIFGPTCDGLDCVVKNVALPRMDRDDWFVFDNMGAYTNVGGSEFNGMPLPKFEYVD